MRQWLKGQVGGACDIEDVVQECYCRLASLDTVAHITQPRAYLFAMARNLALRELRRAKVVRINAMGDDAEQVASEERSPELVVSARQELDRVRAIISVLPERARQIFTLRRIDGLSQKEVAARLGVTEHVVENDASRSLRTVLRMITEADDEADRSDGHAIAG